MEGSDLNKFISRRRLMSLVSSGNTQTTERRAFRGASADAWRDLDRHLNFVSSFQCNPIVGHGFVLDKYRCQCRKGFFHPSRVALNGYKSKFPKYPVKAVGADFFPFS